MTKEENRSFPLVGALRQEPLVMKRSRSLSELPGHLRVPILRRKDTERTTARLEAGVAGMKELQALRQQQEQLMGEAMANAQHKRKIKKSQRQTGDMTDYQADSRTDHQRQADSRTDHHRQADSRTDHQRQADSRADHQRQADSRTDHQRLQQQQKLQQSRQQAHGRSLSSLSAWHSATSLASISEERDVAPSAWTESFNKHTAKTPLGYFSLSDSTDHQLRHRTQPQRQQQDHRAHCPQTENNQNECPDEHCNHRHPQGPPNGHHLEESTRESRSFEQERGHGQIRGHVEHKVRTNLDFGVAKRDPDHSRSTQGSQQRCRSASEHQLGRDQHVRSMSSTLYSPGYNLGDGDRRRKMAHVQSDQRFNRGRSQSVHESFQYFPGKDEDGSEYSQTNRGDLQTSTRPNSYYPYRDSHVPPHNGTLLHHSQSDSNFLCHHRTNSLKGQTCECQAPSSRPIGNLSKVDTTARRHVVATMIPGGEQAGRPSPLNPKQLFSPRSNVNIRSISWDNLLVAVGLQSRSSVAHLNTEKEIAESDEEEGDDEIFESVSSVSNNCGLDLDSLRADKEKKGGLPGKAVRSQSFTSGISVAHDLSLESKRLRTKQPTADFHDKNSVQKGKRESVLGKQEVISTIRRSEAELRRMSAVTEGGAVRQGGAEAEDAAGTTKLRRVSLQCDAVLTRIRESDKVINPLHDVDISSVRCPGPLHAVMLQYSSLSARKTTDNDGTPASTNQPLQTAKHVSSTTLLSDKVSSPSKHSRSLVISNSCKEDNMTNTGLPQSTVSSNESCLPYTALSNVPLSTSSSASKAAKRATANRESIDHTINENMQPSNSALEYRKSVDPISASEGFPKSPSPVCLGINTSSQVTESAFKGEVVKKKDESLKAIYEKIENRGNDIIRQRKLNRSGDMSSHDGYTRLNNVDDVPTSTSKLSNESNTLEGVETMTSQLIPDKPNVSSLQVDTRDVTSTLHDNLSSRLSPPYSLPSHTPEVSMLSDEGYSTCESIGASSRITSSGNNFSNVSSVSSGSVASMSVIEDSPTYLHVGSHSKKDCTPRRSTCSETPTSRTASSSLDILGGKSAQGRARDQKENTPHRSVGYREDCHDTLNKDLEYVSHPAVFTTTVKASRSSPASAEKAQKTLDDVNVVKAPQRRYSADSSGGVTRNKDICREFPSDATRDNQNVHNESFIGATTITDIHKMSFGDATRNSDVHRERADVTEDNDVSLETCGGAVRDTDVSTQSSVAAMKNTDICKDSSRDATRNSDAHNGNDVSVIIEHDGKISVSASYINQEEIIVLENSTGIAMFSDIDEVSSDQDDKVAILEPGGTLICGENTNATVSESCAINGRESGEEVTDSTPSRPFRQTAV